MRNSDDTFLQKALRLMQGSSDEAEAIARDNGKLDKLVNKSRKKMYNVKDKKPNILNFFNQLIVFQRLLKAYSRKEYPNLPWKSLLSIVGAILYFLNPLDLIPDFIPGIGLLDDITLLGWVYKSVASDVEKFEEWEYNNKPVLTE
ncbi:YkvA family protein [Cesiribacter sp. SM1]|uniref:YkvA family protein n=1 Tax=Cesiribacter sp. SM1 TaxID=2861196 RepID=UPI001CD491EB|nr:YkvA family protein [Cesiribacter sp. SM1]